MDRFRERAAARRPSRRATTVGPDGSEAACPASPAIASRTGQEPWDGFRLHVIPGVADMARDTPPEAAPYELPRLDDAVWRHGFVAYLRHHHEAGLASDGRLVGDELAHHLAVARDARVLRRTKAVMEAVHRGQSLSLAELARAGDGPVEDRRKREVGLRERVLWLMDELGAWGVVEVPRAPRPTAHASPASSAVKLATRGVLRYEIGAGPALHAFDRLHYRPWLLRQFERLDASLGCRNTSSTPASDKRMTLAKPSERAAAERRKCCAMRTDHERGSRHPP